MRLIIDTPTTITVSQEQLINQQQHAQINRQLALEATGEGNNGWLAYQLVRTDTILSSATLGSICTQRTLIDGPTVFLAPNNDVLVLQAKYRNHQLIMPWTELSTLISGQKVIFQGVALADKQRVSGFLARYAQQFRVITMATTPALRAS